MKMSISLVVALCMGISASVFAEDRGAAQWSVKPIASSAETELDYSSIVLDEDTTVPNAKSDRTNAREPEVELLSTHIESLVKTELGALADIEGASLDSLNEMVREITEHFESMMDGSFSTSRATDSSVFSKKGRDIVSVVPTKGGVLAVVDFGDGAVHIFAVAYDTENPVLENVAGFALHVAITEQGAEVMSIDEDLLAGFVGMRQRNTELGVVSDAIDGRVRKLDQEQFNEQLFALGSSDIEGAALESLQESAPEVHKFFQYAIASMEDGTFSPSAMSQLFDSSIKQQDSFDVIPMRGGVLTVLDTGEGAIHLIVTAIDHESLNLDEGGFALNLALTQDGVEIMQIDDDLLTQFVSDVGLANAQFSSTEIENNVDDGDIPQTEIACPPAICNSENCCCFITGKIGGEDVVCIGCFSFRHPKLSLSCAKIVIN